MASSSRSSSIPPLSVGDTVSAGFQLYRENAKQYLGIAAAAVGWTLLPILTLIVIALIAAIVAGATQQPATGIGLFVLAFMAVIVLAVFCFAKSSANSALISRLAFGQLSNQPIDAIESRRFVNSRKWSFLYTQFLVALIVGGVFLGFYLIIALLGVGMVLSAGGMASGSGGNAGAAIVLGLLMFAAVIGLLVLVLWLSARLVGAEVPLAVESQSSAPQSVKRFWSLTKGSVWRIVGVTVVASLITLPIALLSNLFSSVPNAIIEASVPEGPNRVILTLLSTLISFAISLALNILVLPLWQSIKAVIYYDLRNRREGLDLQLRDR